MALSISPKGTSTCSWSWKSKPRPCESCRPALPREPGEEAVVVFSSIQHTWPFPLRYWIQNECKNDKYSTCCGNVAWTWSGRATGAVGVQFRYSETVSFWSASSNCCVGVSDRVFPLTCWLSDFLPNEFTSDKTASALTTLGFILYSTISVALSFPERMIQDLLLLTNSDQCYCKYPTASTVFHFSKNWWTARNTFSLFLNDETWTKTAQMSNYLCTK